MQKNKKKNTNRKHILPKKKRTETGQNNSSWRYPLDIIQDVCFQIICIEVVNELGALMIPGFQPRSEGFVPAQLAVGNTNFVNEATTITVSIQTPSNSTSQAVFNHESSNVVSPLKDISSSLPSRLPTVDIIGASSRNGLKPSGQKCPPRLDPRRCRLCACENPCTCPDSCECRNTHWCCRRKIRY